LRLAIHIRSLWLAIHIRSLPIWRINILRIRVLPLIVAAALAHLDVSSIALRKEGAWERLVAIWLRVDCSEGPFATARLVGRGDADDAAHCCQAVREVSEQGALAAGASRRIE